MFNRIVAACVLLAPGIAAAADLQSPSLSQVTFDWNGPYLGAEIGGGWFNDQAGYDPRALSIDTSGLLGGIYGGYNWQTPSNIVLGVDSDFTFNGIDGDGHNSNGYSGSNEWKWTGAVRGRLGYAFDRFLPYVAGGFSYGRIGTTIAYPGGAVVEGKKTVTGWTIGGGIDYAVTNNLIARVEYRYSDFGSNKIPTTYNGQPWADAEVLSNIHDIRVGLSYKF